MSRRLAIVRAALGLALLAIATPGSARAGVAEDMAEATRLLENVEEEKAVPLLLKAVEDPAVTPAEKAELYGLLGVARFNLRDEAGAREAFRKALDADPSISVFKMLAPKGRALFEEVRVQREEELAKAVTPALPPPPPPLAVSARPSGLALGTRAIAGLGVGAGGVVALAVGAGLFANAGALRAQAVAEPSAMSADAIYRSGATQRGAGIGLLAAGAAMVAGGLALFLWPDSPAPVAVGVGPGGIALAGQF